jgi:hypothetical protein
MITDRESRSEQAKPHASPAALILVGLLLVVAYVLSPPFVYAVCHFVGIDFELVLGTAYFPILFVARIAPEVVAPLEAYCEVVVWLLGIPTP